MAKETLTHEEIESLLQHESAQPCRDARGADDGPAEACQPLQTVDQVAPDGGTAIGDPMLVDRLRIACDGVARAFSEALSGMLRAPVTVDVLRVDRLTYGQFVLYRGDPTCYVLLGAEAAGPFALDMEPSIVFPMIERMLGGDGQSATPQPRRLTDIERRLAARIAECFVQQFNRIWRENGAPNLHVQSVQAAAQRVEPRASKEPMMCIAWQVTVGDRRGGLCLAAPWAIVEMAMACPQLADAERQGESEEGSAAEQRVELSAILARTSFSAATIGSLQVGDLITTETTAGDPLEVTVDSQPRFRAQPGVLAGHKALRIE